MQKKYWILYINLLLCWGLFLNVVSAQLPPIPKAEAERYMVDYTQTLKRLELVALNNELKKCQDDHGLHFVTLFSDAVEGYSNERLAFEIYQKWKIGAENKDQGILLLGLVRDSTVVFTYHIGGEARKRIANYKLENTIQETIIPTLNQEDTANYYLALYMGIAQILNLYEGFSGDLNNQSKITQQGQFLTIWDNLISVDASKSIETELGKIQKEQDLRIIIDLCKRGKDDVGMGPAQDRRNNIYEHFAKTYSEEEAQKSIIVLIEQYHSMLDDAIIRNHIHVFQASANKEELAAIENPLRDLQMEYKGSQAYAELINNVIAEVLKSKEKLRTKAKNQQLIFWAIIGGASLVFLLILGRYIYVRRRKQFAFYEQMMQDKVWVSFAEDFTQSSIDAKRKEMKNLFDQHRGKRRENVLQDYFVALKADPPAKLVYKPAYQFKQLQKRVQAQQADFVNQHYVYLLNVLRKELQFFAQKENLKQPKDLDRYRKQIYFFQQCLGYNDDFRGVYYRTYQRVKSIIQELNSDHDLVSKFAQSSILADLESLQKLEKETVIVYINEVRKEGQIEFMYNYLVTVYPIVNRLAAHRSFSVEQIMMKEAVYANLGVQLDKASDLQAFLNELYKSREYFSLVSGAALSKADANYYQSTIEQYLNILQEPIEQLYLDTPFYKQALENYEQHPSMFWAAHTKDHEPKILEELKITYQERIEQIMDADYPIRDLVDFYFYDLKHA